MKINLKLANGATLEFEGDPEEFDRVSAFLAEPPDAFTADASPRSAHKPGLGEERGSLEDADLDNGGGDDGGDGDVRPLDPQNVNRVLQEVNARSDLERVTVMAYLAQMENSEGIDYPTVDALYTDLGLRKPPRFPKAFSNAKLAGLVKNAGYGRWLPTVKGENFARGFGRERDAGSTRRGGRTQLALEPGGDPD